MTIKCIDPVFTHDAGAAEVPGFHIVLVHPEIPPNTGNIARLAAGTGAWLHLVRPLGFKLEDKYVRRAGLDYWPSVRLSVHESLEAVTEALPVERTYLFTKFAEQLHVDSEYPEEPVLVFGSESSGLPKWFKERFSRRLCRIPTTGDIRSLNLSNSVAIAGYEVLRQRGWRGERPMSS